MAYNYHARLQICRHRHELLVHFLAKGVDWNSFVSHPFRRNPILDRHLLLDPTRQYSGFFNNKALHTSWVIFFPIFCSSLCFEFFEFLFLNFLALRPVPFENGFGGTPRLQRYRLLQRLLLKTFSGASKCRVELDRQLFQ